jgi:hypothetical protein
MQVFVQRSELKSIWLKLDGNGVSGANTSNCFTDAMENPTAKHAVALSDRSAYTHNIDLDRRSRQATRYRRGAGEGDSEMATISTRSDSRKDSSEKKIFSP